MSFSDPDIFDVGGFQPKTKQQHSGNTTEAHKAGQYQILVCKH